MECGAKGAGWESVTPPYYICTLKHSHRAELDLQPLQAFFLILLRTEAHKNSKIGTRFLKSK